MKNNFFGRKHDDCFPHKGRKKLWYNKKTGGTISEFLEKPFGNVQDKPRAESTGYINAGFYILSPDIFKNIRKISFSIEKDIFPKLARSGKLGFYEHRGFWTDAGTEERLSEARRRFS